MKRSCWSSSPDNGWVTISKSKDKLDILNHQFYSVFTDEDLSSIPSPTNSFPIMPTISLNVEGIYRLLNDLDVNKAPGPQHQTES